MVSEMRLYFCRMQRVVAPYFTSFHHSDLIVLSSPGLGPHHEFTYRVMSRSEKRGHLSY